MQRILLFHVELWNGNRERWQNLCSLDPEQSVLAWAWTRHHAYRETYTVAERESKIPFVRLQTDERIERFVARLGTIG